MQIKQPAPATDVDCSTRAKADAVGVIDVHTHYVPRGWPDLAAELGGTDWPRLRIHSENEAEIFLGGDSFRTVASNTWDAHRRLEEMDADGVDMQVVSPTPVFFSYDRLAPQAHRLACLFNDLALEICAQGDGRLLPFCQVPLQDPDAACAELDRCVNNGHLGVEIGNHIGDTDLDSVGVTTFLQHCADQNVPVFVHPWDLPSGDRIERWLGQWLVGMPAETHLSMLALVLGGVLDNVPTTLRLAFAHGGGSFAFWLGRMDNAWHRRHDLLGTCEYPPSHYVDRFFVDSVVFSEQALRLLVNVYGADRIMVGSDYPYPLGERPAGKVVHEADFLSGPERTKIMSGTAREFLNVST